MSSIRYFFMELQYGQTQCLKEALHWWPKLIDGCFPSYLHRFRKSDSHACVYCADGNDSAEHTLFNCDAWHVVRRNVEILVGSDLDASNMMDLIPISKTTRMRSVNSLRPSWKRRRKMRGHGRYKSTYLPFKLLIFKIM